MALQKSYLAKIYDADGSTPIATIPQGDGGLKVAPTFRSQINGGLGECILDFDLPFDDFDEGNSIAFMNVVDLYAIDADNPLGRRIYRGFTSRYEPYIDPNGAEGVRVTCLGLVSLLSLSYYKSGATFEVVHSSQDPETIFQAIITHFNTIYGGSLLSTVGGTSTVGTTVSVTFTDQTWADAIRKTVELAGTNWWWSVDANGLCHLAAKPGSATHTFTLKKDIQSITAPKDSEKVINDVQVRRDGGTASNYSDATSQVEFGTGSPATGKRTQIVDDSSLTDVSAADQRGNKLINDNKDEKIKASIVINNKYDLESIKVGDTCKVANLSGDSTFFSSNMLIVALEYQGETVRVELEEEAANFGRELSNIISDTAGSGTSSGGGGGSTPGFVDREVPSGSVNGSNTNFTLSQTPIAGSEHVYLGGVLLDDGGVDYSISGTAITFVTAPESGTILLVSYRTANGSINFVDREVPSGSVNGSNTTFTLAHTPTTGAEHIWVGGVLMNGGGVDYTLSGTTITFVTAPESGSIVLASYRY